MNKIKTNLELVKNEDRKLISVIIPVYNEEKNIALLMIELKKVFSTLLKYHVEFVFVDDSSTDNSLMIIKELASNDSSVKYIELSRNFGKEIATSVGLNFAKGEAVFMLDADLQHPPQLIPEFLNKWEKGAEVIIGIKTSNKDSKLIKRFGSYSFYKIMNLIATIKIIPYSSDFCLLDRKVVKEFNRFSEKNRMTRALINCLGFKRDFVYFEALKRRNGKASYSFFKLCRLALNSFVSLSIIPLKFAGYIGCFTFFISGLLGIYVLLGKYVFHTQLASSFTGTAQLAILIIFLVGIILSCLGIISLYIINIHNEVLNRPLYIIRSKKI